MSAIETTGSFEFQVENNVLIVNHKNAYFCCEQNEIAGEVRFEGNTIFLSESEKNPIANCICPYDLTFAIEGLQEGKYHVIVVKDGLECKDFHIELRSSEGTVVVTHEPAARGSRGPAWRVAVGYDEASLAKK